MADHSTAAPPSATRPTADLRPLRALVARARTRLRLQGAFEGATVASILASASALTTVFAVRTETIGEGTGIGLLVASVGVVGVGAVLGALGQLDDEQVARRIDRASGLADRLSSAVAFERALAAPPGQAAAARAALIAGGDDAETEALMRAAVRDAAAAVPRANVVAATPLRKPRDLNVALGFAAVAIIGSILGIRIPPKDPALLGVTPEAARRGAVVEIDGQRLCGPDGAADVACSLPSAMVYVGDDAAAVAAPIQHWTGGTIAIKVPAGARVGKTELVVWARGKRWGAVPFEVLDDKDPRGIAPDAVALDPDDETYLRDLVADLRDTAKRDDVKELDDYAAKIEQLLDLADNGELTKEELLQKMQEAQAELDAQMEQKPEEILDDLSDTGEILQKNELTRELGAALQKGELEKAKAEMEKLADKLEHGQLDEKQQEQLAQALEKAAQQYEQKQDKKDAQSMQRQQELEQQMRQLEKQRDEAKNEDERADLERRLDKKKDELQQLKKQQEEQQGSKQREALKRLHKEMEKAAEDLQRKPEQGQDKQEQQQQAQKQASRSLRDVADETGKVDADQRKQAAQKKVASQMEDLREAMRRAKQQGKQGPKNPFGQGKQGQSQDFARRAAGQGKGQGKGNQPGQGQNGGKGQQGQGDGNNGQGQGQNGGNGNDPNGPSNTYGDGHDENLVGDATDMSGDTTDESVSGAQGRKGPSRRETILAAAQKGYASREYRDVFVKYKAIVEDVMKSEKVPPSYKYYVKKYFTKIKPHSMQ